MACLRTCFRTLILIGCCLFLITAASPAAAVPPVRQADLDKALACGLDAGLEKLKTGPTEAQDLYKAIEATLIGRDLAENRRLLDRAAVEFGLDILPYGACFHPIFFPDQAGAGPAPAAPSDLTVQPDPKSHYVMLLSWSDNSTDEYGFQVSNGDDHRAAPSHPGTGTVSYKWTGLQPKSWTCFRVRADNGDTFSEWEPSASPHYRCATTSVGEATPSQQQKGPINPNTAFDISSGPPGSTPNLDGGGFYPNKDVTVTESGPAGSRTVGVVRADASGRFNMPLQIGDRTPEGQITFTFRQEPNVKVTDTFYVTRAAATEAPTIEPSETPTSSPTETTTAPTREPSETAKATTAPGTTPSGSVPFYTLAPTS